MPVHLNSTRVAKGKPAPLGAKDRPVGATRDNFFCIGNLTNRTPLDANEGGARIMAMVNRLQKRGWGRQAHLRTLQILNAPLLELSPTEISEFNLMPPPTLSKGEPRHPEYCGWRYTGKNVALCEKILKICNGITYSQMQAHGGQIRSNDSHREIDLIPDGPAQATNFTLLATDHPTAFEAALRNLYVLNGYNIVHIVMRKKGAWNSNTSERRVTVTLPTYIQAVIDLLSHPTYGRPHHSVLNVTVPIPGQLPISVRLIHLHKPVRPSLGPNTMQATGFDFVPSEAAWHILAYSLCEKANEAGVDGELLEVAVIEGNGANWDPTSCLLRVDTVEMCAYIVTHIKFWEPDHPDLPVPLAKAPLRLSLDWAEREIFKDVVAPTVTPAQTAADTEKKNSDARVVASMARKMDEMGEQLATQRTEGIQRDERTLNGLTGMFHLVVAQGTSTNAAFAVMEAQRRYDTIKDKRDGYEDRLLFKEVPLDREAAVQTVIERLNGDLETAKEELDEAKGRGRLTAAEQTAQSTRMMGQITGSSGGSATPGRFAIVDTPEARAIEEARTKKRPSGIAKLAIERTTSAPQLRAKESTDEGESDSDEEEGDVSVSLLHKSPGGTLTNAGGTGVSLVDDSDEEGMGGPRTTVAPLAADWDYEFSFADIPITHRDPTPPADIRPTVLPTRQTTPEMYAEWDEQRSPVYGEPVPRVLAGRVAVANIIVRPATGQPPIKIRIIGVYAPHSQSEGLESFWKEMRNVVSPTAEGPRNWVLIGDINATLDPSESTSVGTHDNSASAHYRQFLRDTNRTDAWVFQDDCDIVRDWTHRNKDGSGTQVLDRVAHSFGPGDVQVERKGSMAATDHRPIWAQLFLPLVLPGVSREEIPNPLQRRLNLPTKGDLEQAAEYAKMIDEGIEAAQLYQVDMETLEGWDCVHQELSRIYRLVGEMVFGVRGSMSWKPKGATPELRAFKDGRIQSHLQHAKKRRHAMDVQRQKTDAIGADAGDAERLLQAGRLRTQCAKELWKMEMSEMRRRAQAREHYRLKQLLRGGSVKQLLMPRGLQVQPVVITSEDRGELIADPAGVRSGIRTYVKELYKKVVEVPEERPWLTSAAAAHFQAEAEKDPFQWPPKKLQLPEYRALLRKGNRAPSPGPDGWEKWSLLLLSDKALTLPLKLLNVTLATNYYSDASRQSYLLPWYKRGVPTELENYRFVAFSCAIPMQAATIFSAALQEYSERRGLIPPEQIATQKGVQGRDSLSFLAQLDATAKRRGITLYDLLRDQKKGFYLLLPEAGYDAYEFFGIGKAAADFDRIRLAHCDLIIKTPYGTAEPFRTEGQVKQGDPPSPVRFSLAMAMGTYWVKEMVPDAIVPIQTKFGAKLPVPDYHTPADRLVLETQAVAAMDDTRIWATSVAKLSELTYYYETFQETYGSRTDWEKKTHVTIIGKQPESPPTTVNLRGTDGMRTVQVVKDYTFLRTDVNNAKLRFQECLAIVENATIPAMETQRLRLSAVLKVVEQTIVSRLRAKINYQPLQQEHAARLDAAIAKRVRQYFDWVFPLANGLLSTPMQFHGFGLTSIAAINRIELVTGLLRDLNHHLEPYRKMAHITLSDLQCGFNHCRHPLKPGGLAVGRRRKIQEAFPVAWIEAVKQISIMGLSIWHTRQDFIGQGDVGLKHLVWSREPKKQFTSSLLSLEREGVYNLQDACAGDGNINPEKFAYNEDVGTAATARTMGKYLQGKNLSMFVNGPPELIKPRQEQRRTAEANIRSIAKANVKGRDNTNTNPYLYATDGSAYGNVSATGATVGRVRMKAVMPSGAVSSMHGELAGLIMMTLADDTVRETNSITLIGPATVGLTYYQNAVAIGLTRNERPRATPLVGTAAPMATWLQTLLKERPHVNLEKLKAHTGAADTMSRMNEDADVAAREAHIQPDFVFPYPTFFLPEYAMHTGTVWHEGSLADLIAKKSHIIEMRNLPEKTAATLERLKALKFSPPAYPYRIAISTYAAQVQVQIRSHTLPVGARCGTRFQNQITGCTYCGADWEDEIHTFEQCEDGKELREQASTSIRIATAATMKACEPNAPANIHKAIGDWAELLPSAREYWNLTALGHVPPSFEEVGEGTSKGGGLGRGEN
ncbi:hypothetical protein P7C70_g2510, partial [Phenoliferia sp. Uapishka_3]